jgi:hypothetical protein
MTTTPTEFEGNIIDTDIQLRLSSTDKVPSSDPVITVELVLY